MLRQLRVTSVALSLLVGLSLTACGTEASSSGSPSPTRVSGGTTDAPGGAGDSTSPTSTSPAGSEAPSQPGFPIVMTRTGGFAGVSNTMTINADGSAVFEGRSGKRQCTVDKAVMEKLSTETAKVAAAPPVKPEPPKTPMPDAFVDSISAGSVQGMLPGSTPEAKALSDIAWPLFLEAGGGSPMPKAPAAGSGITCH